MGHTNQPSTASDDAASRTWVSLRPPVRPGTPQWIRDAAPTTTTTAPPPAVSAPPTVAPTVPGTACRTRRTTPTPTRAGWAVLVASILAIVGLAVGVVSAAVAVAAVPDDAPVLDRQCVTVTDTHRP